MARRLPRPNPAPSHSARLLSHPLPTLNTIPSSTPAVAPGTPLVFLHAYPLNGSLWDAERASFPDRPILAPDFPGFGGRPPAGESLDDFALHILTDMDAARIERAVLVGLSMGGYVAFRIHALAPQRVAALVLADTRAGADTEAGAEKRTMQAARVRAEGTGWLSEAVLPDLLGETTRRERPQVVEAARRMIAAADPEGVARALLAMRNRPDSTPDLPNIRVPVLAIAGEEDGITPPVEAQKIADGVPDGRLVLIPRAGHLSNLENPAAFQEALRDFVAS